MSMHIYSIPECSTDEETFYDDETQRHEVIIDANNLSKSHSYASLIGDEDSLISKDPNTEKELSSVIDNSKCKENNSDNGFLEHDKETSFANVTSSNVNIKEVSSPYLIIEDYASNSSEISTIEKISLPPTDSLKSPSETDFNSRLKVPENYDRPYGDLRKNLGISSSTSELASIKNKQEQELQASQLGSRERSGSLQWVQNIYKSILDFRRPSSIADEQIRKSNEEIEEMEHSDEDESSHHQNKGAGGRRFSENVIGKQQKRFPSFASGLGHLREKWRERHHHVNKRQEVKDYDKIRPDVCPLFTFPKKYDEDEVILDTVLPPPSSNSSQEHILPTPLILHLNQSTAQQLIQEANSMFVSNTSLSDLINDNATQQMLLRYRERKRQVRLMSIQRDILHKLGLTRGPNVTARLSAEERQSLLLSFDRTMIERTNSSENNITTPCAQENDPC